MYAYVVYMHVYVCVWYMSAFMQAWIRERYIYIKLFSFWYRLTRRKDIGKMLVCSKEIMAI